MMVVTILDLIVFAKMVSYAQAHPVFTKRKYRLVCCDLALLVSFSIISCIIIQFQYIIFLTLSQGGNGLACIEVNLLTTSDHYNWKLGQCYATHRDSNGGVYTGKCCVPDGDRILSCMSSEGKGWVNSLVRIGGHTFCDDIVGYNKFTKLKISGTHACTYSLHTYYINDCELHLLIVLNKGFNYSLFIHIALASSLYATSTTGNFYYTT